MSEFVLYKLNEDKVALCDGLLKGFDVRVWEPSLSCFPDKCLRKASTIIWMLFHYFFVFKNSQLKIIYITYKGDLVSKLLLTPGYFKFPFMSEFDMQIGDVWTDSNYRGNGLASYLIAYSRRLIKGGGAIFYIVDSCNNSSIRLAEKNGFELLANGCKKRFLYSSLLGYYDFKCD